MSIGMIGQAKLMKSKNVEHEEELVKQQTKEMKNEILHDADHNKLIKTHNKNETEAKKENDENETLDEE